MNLETLQNLLNECILIEQGGFIGGTFHTDLLEAQQELDEVKKFISKISEELNKSK
jgi:hypothetical protein